MTASTSSSSRYRSPTRPRRSTRLTYAKSSARHHAYDLRTRTVAFASFTLPGGASYLAPAIHNTSLMMPGAS